MRPQREARAPRVSRRGLVLRPLAAIAIIASVLVVLAGPAAAQPRLTFRVTAADGTTIVNVAEVTDDGCNCDTDDARTIVVDPPSGSLSSTGFDLAWLVALALTFVGLGAVLAFRSTRSDGGEPAVAQGDEHGQ